MNKYIFRSTALIFIILAFLAANLPSVMAWDQAPNNQTHQAINREALDKFLQTIAKSNKYKNSPIDLEKVYVGPQVVSYGNFVSTYHVDATHGMTFKDWLIHGGYSADEPHLYASVRHFYNPLPEVGHPQLTDQSEAWDTVGNAIGLELHAVSARDWAFKSTENSFNWIKAFTYYKQALEISDDSQLTEVQGADFRDITIPVGSPDAARNVYLAKAFRGLGETMHLMADMTQPAHVRNDCHPFDEPLEQAVRDSNVRLASYFEAEPHISGDIDFAIDAEIMFEKVALFTNANFYSSDTIYDAASGVNPYNNLKSYPSPQFKDLVLLNSTSTPLGVQVNTPVYGKYFKNKYFEDSNFIPMIQQTYSSYILGTKKEYHVPYSFGLEQSAVLLPIAIKANSKLIDLFFPTMELTLETKQLQINTASDQNYREFETKSQLKHLIDKDAEWKSLGEIRYSGPAELWSERSGRIADKIQFEKGSLKKPLILYTGKPQVTSSAPLAADKYQVQDGDKVYMVINAGGRVFKSDPCPIASASALPPPLPSPSQPPQPSLQPPSGSCNFIGIWKIAHPHPTLYTGYLYLTESGGTATFEGRPFIITGAVVGCKFIGHWHCDRQPYYTDGEIEFTLQDNGSRLYKRESTYQSVKYPIEDWQSPVYFADRVQ